MSKVWKAYLVYALGVLMGVFSVWHAIPFNVRFPLCFIIGLLIGCFIFIWFDD